MSFSSLSEKLCFQNAIHWAFENWKTNRRQISKDSVQRPSIQGYGGFKQILKSPFLCLLIFPQPIFYYYYCLGYNSCFHGSSFSLPPDCIAGRWTITLFTVFLHVCPLLHHQLCLLTCNYLPPTEMERNTQKENYSSVNTQKQERKNLLVPKQKTTNPTGNHTTPIQTQHTAWETN